MRAGDALAIAAAALAAPLAAGSSDALTAAELMRSLASVPSSSARFVETRYAAILRSPLVTTGRLVYRRADRLEKHVETPYRESIVIEGGSVVVSGRPDAPARTMPLTAGGPAEPLIESLRATLAGDLATLERHFAVDVRGTRDAWTLSLAPREASLRAIVTRIDFAGRGERVHRIEVVEPSGDRTVTAITHEGR